MKYRILLILMLLSLFSFSQELTSNSPQSEKQFSCYLHFQDSFSDPDFNKSSLPLIYSNKVFSLGDISFAYTIKRTRISHEFEFSPFFFNWGKKETMFSGVYIDANILDFHVFAKYHFNYFIFKDARKWNPFIGISLGFTFEKVMAQPLLSVAFPTTNSLFTLPFEIIPGIKHPISNKLSWAIEFPVIINSFYCEYTKIENPAIPVKLRTNNVYYGILLPKIIHVQFGLSYKLNKK